MSGRDNKKGRSRRSARQAAERVIQTLSAAGYRAVLAGGCVRDLLLDQTPKDYDVATAATPDEICALFPRAQRVGAHFGVVLIRDSGHAIEVATFRTDGDYSDGRHPDSVTFTTAEEDALRRDFTINGMFLDPATNEVLDYVGGRDDLAARLIQAIGNPEQRFDEDRLRMIRAVRFAARLGFSIEQETFEAIWNRAEQLSIISAERIREELEKILVHPSRAAGVQMLIDTGLINALWPEPDWSTSRLASAVRGLEGLPAQAPFPLSLAVLLFDHSPKAVNRICRDLKCSNADRHGTAWLTREAAAFETHRYDTLARLKRCIAQPGFAGLVPFLTARAAATGSDTTAIASLEERAALIPCDHVAPPPFVRGEDLQELGLAAGPAFAQILDALYDEQLELTLHSREAALTRARERIENEQ
jgi:tRNA nucleotidyltransferase/poly(A) polymerase